jgi:glyoxylase-like metal-dependent hydrolase (beta-lactamase superfamily II)
MPAFQGDNAKFLPTQTFDDKMTLLGGADQIDLYYFGRGHTNGDAIVVFPALRAMHSGDLFSGRTMPIMDVKNGGSGFDYPVTLKKAAAGIENVDTVIPGHDIVMPWSAFVDYGEFLQWEVDTTRQAAKEGKTPEQAAAALTPPDKFNGYKTERAAANVAVIYGEIAK